MRISLLPTVKPITVALLTGAAIWTFSGTANALGAASADTMSTTVLAGPSDETGDPGGWLPPVGTMTPNDDPGGWITTGVEEGDPGAWVPPQPIAATEDPGGW